MKNEKVAMAKIEWDSIAKHYDQIFSYWKKDIHFWVKLSKTIKSPILELCCGTGRLTIPMVKAGAKIVGLDISEELIKRAKIKVPDKLKDRVVFLRGDANSFIIPGIKFEAIIMPWGFVPISNDLFKQPITSIKAHLATKGVFIVDIENNQNHKKNWCFLKSREVIRDDERNETLYRFAYNRGNAGLEIGRIVYILLVISDNGKVKRYLTTRVYKHFSKNDLELMLIQNGFYIEKIYGDYEFNSWRPDSERAIFVAKLSKIQNLTIIRYYFALSRKYLLQLTEMFSTSLINSRGKLKKLFRITMSKVLF